MAQPKHDITTMNQTTITGAKLRATATHLIVHQPSHNKPYELWTQHMSEYSALKTMRALGRNVAMGHYRMIPRADMDKWLTA